MRSPRPSRLRFRIIIGTCLTWLVQKTSNTLHQRRLQRSTSQHFCAGRPFGMNIPTPPGTNAISRLQDRIAPILSTVPPHSSTHSPSPRNIVGVRILHCLKNDKLDDLKSTATAQCKERDRPRSPHSRALSRWDFVLSAVLVQVIRHTGLLSPLSPGAVVPRAVPLENGAWEVIRYKEASRDTRLRLTVALRNDRSRRERLRKGRSGQPTPPACGGGAGMWCRSGESCRRL